MSFSAARIVIGECRFVREVKTSRRGRGFRREDVQVSRYVCACGYATCWRQEPRRVEREASRHALDGQLMVDSWR